MEIYQLQESVNELKEKLYDEVKKSDGLEKDIEELSEEINQIRM